MSDLEKYDQVFVETFAVEVGKLGADFNSGSVDNWDSVLQLSLVTAVEDEFDVMFEPEDIMDFKSYNYGKEILKKYGVEL